MLTQYLILEDTNATGMFYLTEGKLNVYDNYNYPWESIHTYGTVYNLVSE